MKTILCTVLIILTSVSGFAKSPKRNASIHTVQQSLKKEGITVYGYESKITPIIPDSTTTEKKEETVRISISFNLNHTNFNPSWINSLQQATSLQSDTVTILDDGFEQEFPGNTWHRSGDPTWGKSDYKSYNGSYSIWCAKDSTESVEPGTPYPPNCNAMIIYGPFDLDDYNYSELSFYYWLDTEIEKDWLLYSVSTNGLDFSGVGLSGQTGKWQEEKNYLSNFPGLGNLCGEEKIWIAFSFISDEHTTTDKGVFIDKVLLTKQIIHEGTPLAGALSGNLGKAASPYIVMDDIGVLEDSSLIIDAGVSIRFSSQTGCFIEGTLKAEGTDEDSIYYISNLAEPEYGDWGGLWISSANSDSCILSNCKVQHGGAEVIYGFPSANIFIQSDNAIIRNCLTEDIGCFRANPQIESSTIGIVRCIESSSPTIQNNVMDEIYTGMWSNPLVKSNIIEGGGIHSSGGNPQIIGNIIKNCETAISAYARTIYDQSANLTIINNKIINNTEDAINLGQGALNSYIIGNLIAKNENAIIHTDDYSNLLILNNTIVDNEVYGINANGDLRSSNIIYNNIIANNRGWGIAIDVKNNLSIAHNNIYNNSINFSLYDSTQIGIIDQKNINGDDCDRFYNIFVNPSFLYDDSLSYHLGKNSPCINAGQPSPFYNDYDKSINDIGAYGGSLLHVGFLQHDFGSVIQNSSTSSELVIYNFRETPVTLDDIQLIDKQNFGVGNTMLSISPLSSQGFSLSFQPQTIGEYQTDLKLLSDDFFSTLPAIIKLRGFGIQGTNVTDSHIKGVWKKENSPYIIQRTVCLSYGDTLHIEPGVEVRFNGPFVFIIEGNLISNGTEKQPIHFTSHGSVEYSGGDGLRFRASNEPRRLEYCIIEKMRNLYDTYSRNDTEAIYASKCQILFKNCIIQNNYGGAIQLRDCPFVNFERTQISRNSGTGLICSYSDSVVVQSSIIQENLKEGIISYGTALLVYNSKISKNNGGGIRFLGQRKATVLNSTISNNIAARGGGVFFNSRGFSIINSIMYGNIAQTGYGGAIHQDYYSNPLTVKNCIIWNNNASSYSGIYAIQNSNVDITYSNLQNEWQDVGNIYTNPLFVNPDIDDFHLQSSSLSIDAGCDSAAYNDIEDPQNPGYALFPSMGGIRNDMGIYGGPLAHAWIEFQENIPPNPFNLLSPSINDTVYVLSPTLKWETAFDLNANDQVSYTLFLSNDSLFEMQDSVQTFQSTSFQTKGLKDYHTYYWKVKAIDQHGASTMSININKFYVFASPKPFHLIAPAPDDTTNEQSILFQWGVAFDPNPLDTVYYELVLGRVKPFVNPTVQATTIDTFAILDNVFDDSTYYYWSVRAKDSDDYFTSSVDTFTFWNPSTFVFQNAQAPKNFALDPNYPNPFNPQTTIKYQLPQKSHVSITIYDILGKKVITLIDHSQLPGFYNVSWDGKDSLGNFVSSGTYFYRMDANKFSKTRKLLLIR